MLRIVAGPVVEAKSAAADTASPTLKDIANQTIIVEAMYRTWFSKLAVAESLYRSEMANTGVDVFDFVIGDFDGDGQP